MARTEAQEPGEPGPECQPGTEADEAHRRRHLEIEGERQAQDGEGSEREPCGPAAPRRRRHLDGDDAEEEGQALDGVEAGEMRALDGEGREGEKGGAEPGGTGSGMRAKPEEESGDQGGGGQGRRQPGGPEALAEKTEGLGHQDGVELGARVDAVQDARLAGGEPAPGRQHMVVLVEGARRSAEADQEEAKRQDEDEQRRQLVPGVGRGAGRPHPGSRPARPRVNREAAHRDP